MNAEWVEIDFKARKELAREKSYSDNNEYE
jgi:hypothetical protein